MKQILHKLAELQISLEALDSHLNLIIKDDVYDIDSLNQAEVILQKYHQQITKLENTILNRRIELLEKKVTIIADAQQPAPSIIEPVIEPVVDK